RPVPGPRGRVSEETCQEGPQAGLEPERDVQRRVRVEKRPRAVGPQTRVRERDRLAGGQPAGVAPRGPGRDARAVHDGDLVPALLQVPRRRQPDDAGPDDHRGAHAASPWTTDGGVGWRAYRA